MFRIRTSVALATMISLAGCATNPQTGKIELAPAVKHEIDSVKSGIASIYDNPDPCSNNDRNIGITLGAIGGAILGHELKNNTAGALLGAAVGAGVGGLIGHNMDARRCKLSQIAKENHLTLASAVITSEKLDSGTAPTAPTGGNKSAALGLDVMVKNDGEEFQPGSSVLTPKAKKAYGEIADQYRPEAIASGTDQKSRYAALAAARDRKVLIVGHADDSGDPARAARLSEARAKAVARTFAEHGVPVSNIYYQGAGDSLPISSNDTPLGRADNRRVQIVDLPSDADLKKYLSLRSADPRRFQSAASSTVSAPRAVAAASAKAETRHAGRRRSEVTSYDFGGNPDTGGEMINLGASVDHSMFSLVTAANAGPIMMNSCTHDHPHDATPVRNLATGDALQVRDAIPGLYGAPIVGLMNGNMVAVIDPYAPKDAGTPAPEPELEVYRDYSKKHERRASFKQHVPVNIYRGTDATLYRMFVTGHGSPMECMDLVVPAKSALNVGAKVHYLRGGEQYTAQGNFSTKH